MNKNIKYYKSKDGCQFIAADTDNSPVLGYIRCVSYQTDGTNPSRSKAKSGEIVSEKIIAAYFTEITKADFMTAAARITFDIQQKAGIAEGL